MSKPFEEIANEATQLPRELRLNLASLLLDLDEPDSAEEIKAEWEQEIVARIRAVDEQSVASATYEEVLQDAEDLLSS